MAKRWGGFLAQNLMAKEEWDLFEACHAQTRERARAEEQTADHELSERLVLTLERVEDAE